MIVDDSPSRPVRLTLTRPIKHNCIDRWKWVFIAFVGNSPFRQTDCRDLGKSKSTLADNLYFWSARMEESACFRPVNDGQTVYQNSSQMMQNVTPPKWISANILPSIDQNFESPTFDFILAALPSVVFFSHKTTNQSNK